MSFEPEIEELLEKLALQRAEIDVQQSMPNPLIPQKIALQKCQLERIGQLKNSVGVLSRGFLELNQKLKDLAENDPNFDISNIPDQWDQFFNYEAPLNKIDEIIPEETFKRFNAAAASAYENENYNQSFLIYSFLSFLKPGERAYFIGKGNSEYHQGHFREALQTYVKLQQMDPQNPYVFFYQAHCYWNLGETHLAVQFAKDALELINQQPSLSFLLPEAEALLTFFKK